MHLQHLAILRYINSLNNNNNGGHVYGGLFYRCGDFMLFDWVLCIFWQLLSCFLVFNNSLHFVVFRLSSLSGCNLLLEFRESRVGVAFRPVYR